VFTWPIKLVTPVAMLFLGCGGSVSSESAAILTVASELRDELAGLAPAQTVAGAPQWINGDSLPAQLLAEVGRVTGLPVWDMERQRDGSVAALAFHRPSMADPSRVTVVAELLTFGANSFSGRDWTFLLECLEGCRVVERSQEPGWLN